MRLKSVVAVALAFGALLALPAAASATIHPIVVSFVCASGTAMENHPLGDVADPPGQTPGYGSHSEQSSLRAIQQAPLQAWKFDPDTFEPTSPALTNCAKSPFGP
jgi:hypothetical protein